jgi:hypothetical protein
VAFYPVRIPRTQEIGRTEAFNATTSDLAFGLATTQDWAGPTTYLLYFYAAGAGENNLAYMVAKVPSAGTAGTRINLSDSSGTPQIQFGVTSTTANAPNRSSATGTFLYGVWTHAAITWPGSTTASTIQIYRGVSGVPLVEQAYASAGVNGSGTLNAGSGNNLHIGNRENTDRTYNGTLAYVARWNRVLPLTELRRAQQDGPLSVPEGLILCWSGGRDWSPSGLLATRTAVLMDGVGPQNNVLGMGYRTIGFNISDGGSAFPWHYYAQQMSA